MFEALLTMTLMYSNVVGRETHTAAETRVEAHVQQRDGGSHAQAAGASSAIGLEAGRLSHIAAAIDAASGESRFVPHGLGQFHDESADNMYQGGLVADELRQTDDLAHHSYLARRWDWYHAHEQTRHGSTVPPSLNPRMNHY